MKSIAFVIPYFGKFPNYFSLWLQSCRNNPTIDWLLFTDSNEKYDYPKNVKVTLIQFGELRDKIQNLFDFEISLLKPYKLCDFRPSYGEIFKEQLVGYDYWGFCDIDLIWGDLRKFLTDDLLNNDRVGFNGHCTIIKNTEELRNLYKQNVESVPNYRWVFSSPMSFCFDEGHAFNKYFHIYGYSIVSIPRVFDVRIKNKGFLPAKKLSQNVSLSPSAFEYKGGELRCYYLSESLHEASEEISYLHLQKRSMNMHVLNYSDSFTIIPNSFEAYESKMECAYQNKLRGVRFWYWKYLTKYWYEEILGIHRFYHYKYPWLSKLMESVFALK